jgi:signal peptidase I
VRLTSPVRRKRVVVPVAPIVAVVVLFAALWWAGLLVPVRSGGSQSMAPTLPACNERWVAEGFTYRFRDPHSGELVVIHARGQLGGPVVPDPRSRDLNLTKRVIGVPGDTVVARDGRAIVNGKKADDIRTDAFAPLHLGAKQYFVLGDNRSFSQDSRDFGPVPRDAIFARVLLTHWPLGRFGVPGYNKTLTPPGQVC